MCSRCTIKHLCLLLLVITEVVVFIGCGKKSERQHLSVKRGEDNLLVFEKKIHLKSDTLRLPEGREVKVNKGNKPIKYTKKSFDFEPISMDSLKVEDSTELKPSKILIIGKDIPTPVTEKIIKEEIKFSFPEHTYFDKYQFENVGYFVTKKISQDAGLPRDNYNFLIADKNGYIWAGTEENGLYLIGSNFYLNFNKSNVLPDNSITSLHIDSANNVWIGTRKGLIYFDGLKFYRIKNYGLDTSFIYCVVGRKNKTFIGAKNNLVELGLNNHINKVQFNNKNSIIENISCVKNNVWFKICELSKNGKYCKSNYLLKLNGQNIELYNVNASLLPSNKFAKEDFWLLIDDQIKKIKGDKLYSYKLRNFNNNYYYELYSRKDGSLWLNSDSFLLKLNEKNNILKLNFKNLWISSIETLDNNLFLSFNKNLNVLFIPHYKVNIDKVLFDYDFDPDDFNVQQILSKKNKIFVLINYSNLIEYNLLEKKFILKKLHNLEFFSSTKCLNSLLFFNDTGLYLLDSNGNIKLLYTFNLGKSFIESIIDEDSTLYIKTGVLNSIDTVYFSGIYKIIKDKIFHFYSITNNFTKTHKVFKSNNNNIVFICDKELVFLNKNKLRLFYSNEIDLKPLSLLFNINKDYWFNNQESRLFKLSNDTLFQYKINDLNTSNELNIVHSFHQLNDYYLVNSYGELYKLQNTILRKIIGNKRLYNEYKSDNYNLKYNIDRDGDIWFHNYYSLFLIKNDTVYEFNEQDGIKPNPLCNFIDENNNYWYVTKESVNLVNLNELKKSVNAKTHNPQLHFITINGQKIDFRAFKYHPGLIPDSLYQKYNDMTFDSVSRFFNYPYNLSLPYHLNHLTFYFSSNDWSAPHHLKYQYKLEGFDETWNTITSEIKADYRNIPPGKYVFKIRAVGISKKWSDVFEYPFEIRPPWYKSKLAYVSYVVITFGSIIFVVKQREKRLIRKQRELELKIAEATEVIRKQKEIVEEKNQEIIDSIRYAERIQQALLAGRKLLDIHLKKEYFIFYRPKDFVSGDFYWASVLSNGQFALMCADSTGHGVPGAIMSILNMACLDKAVNERKLVYPNEIMNYTRDILIGYLNRDSKEEIKDGMDGSLISIDFADKKIYASCANNPIWVIRKRQVYEIIPDKMPIGKSEKDNVPFNLHIMDIMEGDMIYMFTDGFQDQFGGPKGKKYKRMQLKDFLVSISDYNHIEQEKMIEEEFNNWKRDYEQTDDVTVIGIRIYK